MSEMLNLPRLCRIATPGVELARLHPIKCTISESSSPLSTGSMTLPGDDYPVEPGMVVEVYSATRSLGCYRVGAVSRRFSGGYKTQELTLEHCLVLLSNNIMVGERKWEDGTTNSLTILNAILATQNRKHWVLGDDQEAISYLQSQKIDMKFEDEDLLNCLIDFCAYLPEQMYIETDTSAYPWKLMPKKIPTDVQSEARLSRNVESLTVKLDYSTCVTRLFPRGGNGPDNKPVTIKTAYQSGGKEYIEATDTIDIYGLL